MSAVQYTALSVVIIHLTRTVHKGKLRRHLGKLIPLYMGILLEEIQSVAAKCQKQCFRLKNLHLFKRLPKCIKNLIMRCKGKPEFISGIQHQHKIKLTVFSVIDGNHTDVYPITLGNQRKLTDITCQIRIRIYSEILSVNINSRHRVDGNNKTLTLCRVLSELYGKFSSYRFPAESII